MQTIDFNIHEQVGYLGLNRPDKRNALSKEMIRELIQTLEEQKSNQSFRVLVLYGKEDNFCSGADLEWMKQGKTQKKTENIDDAKSFIRLFESLNNFPKPVICEVAKSAFGGAVGLVCCADIVISGSSAKFGFPEVKLGLIPATIAPYVLSKMGNSNTRKRMLFPEPFSAQEAKEEGLVHFVVNDDEIRDKTISISKSIVNSAPAAMIQTKSLILSLNQDSEDESNRLFCARIIASARGSLEGQEGVSAFFEKRRPVW